MTIERSDALLRLIALPILHGQGGEDGSIQGTLETARIPFMGSGVLASAVCIDKQVTKALLRDAGVPVTPFLSLTRPEKPHLSDLKSALGGEIFFVKPARLGSSIGISKVATEGELSSALALAFDQDVRADIDETCAARVQDMSIRAYRALGCEGMARVDFFLKDNGDLLVNEVNTIPGFTSHSMYPKMIESAGISYRELLDILLKQAVARFVERHSHAVNPVGSVR